MARRGVLVLVAVAAARQGTACVDPKTDYDDFLARVPAVNLDASTGDTGTPALPCSTLLANNASGAFYGACLTSASAGDPSAAIYVVLQDAVAVDPGGATGALTLTQTYLKEHPTNTSETIGAAITYPPSPISADCTYVLDAGTVTIPGAANSDGVDLVLSGTAYRSKLVTDDLSCAALDTTVTAPVMVDLTKGGNYCVFKRAPADGTVTPFTLADFACPGAPAR